MPREPPGTWTTANPKPISVRISQAPHDTKRFIRVIFYNSKFIIIIIIIISTDREGLRPGEPQPMGDPTCTLDLNESVVCAQYTNSQYLFLFGRDSERKIARIMLSNSAHPSPFDMCIEPMMIEGDRVNLLKLVAYLPSVKKVRNNRTIN